MQLTEFIKQNFITDFSRSLEKIAKEISKEIQLSENKLSSNSNSHGEQQYDLDLACDEIFFKEISSLDFVSSIVSEEREEEVFVSDSGDFVFAYDPLDGSSLIDTNLSIGSIFTLYSGKSLVGKSGKDLICSGAFVFGPKTSLLISFGVGVFEFVLRDGVFEFSRELKIKKETKIFSPGNLRAAKENQGYKKLLDTWLDEGKTLRYSGGMVPDLNQIFCKGEGIFSYPSNSKYPNGKLRLAYEVLPFSFLAESSGGKSVNENGERILDLEIQEIHQRSTIFIGSSSEVERALVVLRF